MSNEKRAKTSSNLMEHHNTYHFFLDKKAYGKKEKNDKGEKDRGKEKDSKREKNRKKDKNGKEEELESTLQDLNGLLNAVGVEITVDGLTLTIDISSEKFASVTKRKAGRKKKDVKKQYEEIMAYRKTHTAEETFAWLGLTKQTYYRRLKEMREEISQN